MPEQHPIFCINENIQKNKVWRWRRWYGCCCWWQHKPSKIPLQNIPIFIINTSSSKTIFFVCEWELTAAQYAFLFVIFSSIKVKFVSHQVLSLTFIAWRAIIILHISVEQKCMNSKCNSGESISFIICVRRWCYFVAYDIPGAAILCNKSSHLYVRAVEGVQYSPFSFICLTAFRLLLMLFMRWMPIKSIDGEWRLWWNKDEFNILFLFAHNSGIY